MRRSARLAAAAIATVAVALLLPAAADWLVLRDGSRVETDGPWRVESRLVAFKRPDGTFASLRLSEVDLDASRRVTLEEAERSVAAADAAPAEPAREAVVRLTERDLPPVDRPLRAEPEEEDAEEATEAGPPPLEIVTWREVGEIDGTGTEIVGTVRNNSTSLAIGVGVTAALFDADDEEVARTQAIVTSTALQPAQTSAFRASFPGVYQYFRVELRAAGSLVTTERPDAEEPESPPL